MKAIEAKQITDINAPKAIERNRKKSEVELKSVYYQIKINAKSGHNQLMWDYRDCHDKQHIIDKLIDDKYIVEYSNYPYVKIEW